ncbi:class I SAM-dependent methyltransferase [Acidicapsa ligni]|uniref:class I SAM-dependent methyltransferase n=1 Tax=Acidicapsa ligni TaxID=542300 RepID=UPI0037BF81FC
MHVRTFLHLRQQRAVVSSSIRPERPYEFYRLWLGSSMVFSSAYFQTPEEDLNHAQETGLERICNKLQLTKTDRFLDLNCNWGSLLLHAGAFHETPSHGFSQSNEQLTTVELRLVETGLTSRCAVHRGTYKDLQEVRVPFTKIASVGFTELALDVQHLDYFRSIYQKLSPGGLFLVDFVTRSSSPLDLEFETGSGFAYRTLPKLSLILESVEKAGFVIANIEELRDQFEATLRLWFSALAKHRHELSRMTCRRSVRAWELCLACAVESTRAGQISLYQILLRRPLEYSPQKEASAAASQAGGDLYPLPDSMPVRARRETGSW